jgi:hypothetical protein
MNSPDCPTCGGEFHTVRMRREAMEYALSALGKESYDELCSGCRKIARGGQKLPYDSPGSEGVVAET